MGAIVKRGRGGARPGSGPKPKPVEQHQRNRIMVNLTDDEYRKLRTAAKGGSVSGLARSVLLRYLARRRK